MHLINDMVMNRYFTVFSILIQVRQQRRVLGLLWKNLRTEGKSQHMPDRSLRKLLFVRSAADNTLANFESFVCHFCIETAWKSLLKALASANSFNRIFKVHIRYLNAIIESITFGGFRSANFKNFQDCLDSISQLNNLVRSVHLGDVGL